MTRFALMIAAVLFCLVPPAFAAEKLDVLDCRAGTLTVLHASPELTVYSFELYGIARTQNANQDWEAASVRCVGVARLGASDANGFCKWKDVDGNLAFAQWHETESHSGTWSFIGGTGKWKGITGSGRWQQTTRAQRIEPGTFQNCHRITGSYERGA